MLFRSDAKIGDLVGNTAEEQAEQVLKNLGAILKSQGLSFESVVKATVFAKDMNDFSAVNDVYARYFKVDPPARVFVEVSRLPRDVLVEIDAVAVKDESIDKEEENTYCFISRLKPADSAVWEALSKCRVRSNGLMRQRGTVSSPPTKATMSLSTSARSWEKDSRRLPKGSVSSSR